MITKYLEHCELNKNLSQKTLKLYRNALKPFDLFFGKLNLTRITVDKMNEYVRFLQGKKLTLKSITIYMSVAKQFLNWHQVPIDTRQVDIPKTQKYTFSFTKEDYDFVEKTIEWLPAGRDRAIFTMLYDCGLRVSELVSLNISAIDGKKLVVKGKGNKVRVVFLSDRVLAEIKDMLSDRPDSPLFKNYKGIRLADGGVRKIFKTLTGGKLHPHMLRHMFATRMLEKGVKIENLSLMLGHSSIVTTQIYLHTSNEHLMNVWKECVDVA